MASAHNACMKRGVAMWGLSRCDVILDQPYSAWQVHSNAQGALLHLNQADGMNETYTRESS